MTSHNNGPRCVRHIKRHARTHTMARVWYMDADGLIYRRTWHSFREERLLDKNWLAQRDERRAVRRQHGKGWEF